MKYLKIAVLLLVVMISFNVVSAFAYEETDEALLFNLGILNEEITEKENVTRAEFTAIVTRLMNINNHTVRKVFEDVELSDENAGSITTLYDLGYISGNGSGYFNPDETILTEHAAKIIVSALGYHDVCIMKNDFVAMAYKLDLFDKIGNSGILSGEKCVKLLSNALKAPYLSTDTVSQNGITYKSDANILFECFDIYTVEGIVSSVDGANLTGTSESSEGQMVINKRNYYISKDSGYGKMLGYKVKAYVEKNTDNIIHCIYKNNRTVEISADDLDTDRTTLKNIYTENKNYAISSDADYLYNGNGYFGITLPEMLIKCGKITLIDNDNDGDYDIVDIYSYISCAVSVANYDTLTLFDFYSNTVPSLEKADRIEVYKNGEKISFSDILQNNIALVAVDKSGKFAQILVTDERVNGTIETLGEDEVEINGKLYKISPSLLAVGDTLTKLSPGKKVELRIDAFGKIAYIRSSENDGLKYGWLIDFALGKGISGGNHEAKLLQENGQIGIFKCVRDLKLNGAKAENDALIAAFSSMGEIKEQLIKYTLDEEGNIKRIYTLSGGEISMDFPYAQRAQASGGLRVFADDGDFVYNANTIIFSVPLYPENAIDEDYTVTTSVYGEYTTSQIAAFDVNEYQIASVIVRKNGSTTNSGTITNDDKNYNPLLVVDKIKMSTNYKGEEEAVLYCRSKNGDVKYYVSEDKYSLISDIKKGDIILLRYNQATEHVIDIYKNIRDAVKTNTFGHVDEIVSTTDGSRYFEWIYGCVYTRFGDTIKISDKETPSKPSDYRVYAAGAAKVIVIGDDIRYGNLANVNPGAKIVLRSRGAAVQEIIVFE